jgi:hypothetical protein
VSRVGALDEAHHQLAVEPAREVGDPVDHLWRAFLVGLDGEAKAIPASQRGSLSTAWITSSDNSRRSASSASTVDSIVRLRLPREAQDDRHELAHHALTRERLVARMQRR